MLRTCPARRPLPRTSPRRGGWPSTSGAIACVRRCLAFRPLRDHVLTPLCACSIAPPAASPLARAGGWSSACWQRRSDHKCCVLEMHPHRSLQVVSCATAQHAARAGRALLSSAVSTRHCSQSVTAVPEIDGQSCTTFVISRSRVLSLRVATRRACTSTTVSTRTAHRKTPNLRPDPDRVRGREHGNKTEM